MTIDAYSHCPGGTGKKVKFCCGDFLSELQKIDRMLEGEQYLACLQTIDQLLQPPARSRECLMAIKGLVLRLTGQEEAAKAHAAEFLAKHPHNEIALAESAILNSDEDARPALAKLQEALKAADGTISPRSYEAMGRVAAGLLDEGYWLPGRSLLQLQVAVSEEHDEPVQMLLSLNRSSEIPLLLRDDPPLLPCPEDVPWRERYHDAVETVGFGDWATAAGKLTALAADVPDSPAVWRTLATLRGWLADNDGCAAALRKYAALCAGDASRWDEAVECEAAAMLLADDPLGDRMDMFRLEWVVKDVDRLQDLLLSSPRLKTIPFDPAHFADGETPPPKAAYMMLDRAMPEASEAVSLANAPRLFGQALLFGRQTDREARLEVMGVAADELPAVKQFLVELAGDAIDPQNTEEVAGHWSASQRLLRPAWQPPSGAAPQQIKDLFVEHLRDALLVRWPNVKLGVLGGRTSREAAGDERCRVTLAAAVMVLEYWSERVADSFDFNELRSRLGLPVLGPIDPQQQPVGALPLVRLSRVLPEGLSDEDLVLAYRRASAFAVRPAILKFAQAIVERSSLSGKAEQLPAYASLARATADPDKALEYVNQGRQAAEAGGHSSASWDLLELSLHFGRRDGHEAVRLVEHIQHKHLEEPGVAEALTRMLMDVGLLRPDGSPAFGPHAQPAEYAEEAPAAEATKLWTPDSESGGGSGGKLWTPE